MVSGWCPCVPIGRRESPAQQQSAASSSRSYGTDGAPFTVSAATDRAEMVQMFYYENRGKCCKKLLRYNGYPNKVRRRRPPSLRYPSFPSRRFESTTEWTYFRFEHQAFEPRSLSRGRNVSLTIRFGSKSLPFERKDSSNSLEERSVPSSRGEVEEERREGGREREDGSKYPKAPGEINRFAI